MKNTHRTIVAAIIFSQDGKILMGKKDTEKGGVYPNCWHIPGGGVKKDESEINALKREILEEVGINISLRTTNLIDDLGVGKSIKTLNNGDKVMCHMVFHVYKVTIDKKSHDIPIVLSDDLVVVKWFDINELESISLTPPSRELFDRLGILTQSHV